jgi:hypothetical protein
MRFMVIVKATKNSEAGVMPSEQLLTEMGKYNEEPAKAGVLLAGEGLHPSSKGARVKFSGGERTVIDGPFSETKELVAGFWLWKCDSLQEAIEWVKRCPNPMPGEESEIEIRQVFEAEDFGPALTPSFACRKSGCARKLRKIKAHELPSEETLVKYICLGYLDEKMETMSESDQNALIDQCFAYDDVLRKNGHFVGGEALQLREERNDAAMPKWQGVHHRWPYAEAKEQLGGLLILEGDGS